MKKLFYLMLCTLVMCYSCKNNDDDSYITYTFAVQLAYPENSGFSATEGVNVKLTSSSSSYDAMTDATGTATFTVPAGIYEISVTDIRSSGGTAFIYNGVRSGVTIPGNYTGNYSSGDNNGIILGLEESQSSQVVIKEVYVGGVQKDDGSGPFAYDKYVILYNNSNTIAHLGNLSLATTMPYNGHASNSYYGVDGRLTYESEGWVPAGQAIWYFQQDVAIEPGKQVVIALNNAVNNTLTHSNSINFDNAAYYCTYDIEQFNHALTYVAPAASIPTSHYLKVAKYGTGTGWSLSNTSPGFFIFDPEGYTPVSFAADVSRTDNYNGSTSLVSKKVPVEWVVDGVDGFLLNNANNKKRLTSTIDAGYVYHLNSQGYSIYRNVDAEATKAIEGNEAKLVYSYQYGTTDIGGTTDPSGIDAEASIRNGARIVYKDTNNSTNDFHLRSRASLRN